jgi:hypothetical protein
MSNRCPIDGCDTRIARSRVMCRKHWYMVPRPLRDDVWTTYRRDGVLSEEYQDARDAAIAAVEMEEADNG